MTISVFHVIRTGVMQSILHCTVYTLQKNAENLKQIFPGKEYRGLSPNFHIHGSVSELYIPTMGLLFLLEEICGFVDPSWEYINVEIGAEAAQFPEKEYINRIALAVQYKNTRKRTCCLASSHWSSEPVFTNPEPQESIPSLAGRYDNPFWRSGPPGYIGLRNRFLLERLQIRALTQRIFHRIWGCHTLARMLKIPYRWLYSAGILVQSMGVRNRVGIGSSYWRAKRHRLADSISWNWFLGSLKFKNTGTVLPCSVLYNVRKGYFKNLQQGHKVTL